MRKNLLKAVFNPCHGTLSPEEVGDPQRWAVKTLPSPQRGTWISLSYDAKAATNYISNAFLKALGDAAAQRLDSRGDEFAVAGLPEDLTRNLLRGMGAPLALYSDDNVFVIITESKWRHSPEDWFCKDSPHRKALCHRPCVSCWQRKLD